MTQETSDTRCSSCREVIDCCEFCDSPDCPAGICFECRNVALGQIILQPHVHTE